MSLVAVLCEVIQASSSGSKSLTMEPNLLRGIPRKLIAAARFLGRAARAEEWDRPDGRCCITLNANQT